MDSKLLLTLAELLTECPKCMKTTLDGGADLQITTKEIKRSCPCGYSIKLTIEEGTVPKDNKNKNSILRG